MVKSLIQKMREGLVITKDNKITVGSIKSTKTSIPNNTYETLYTTDVNTPTIVSDIYIITDQSMAGVQQLVFDIVIDGVSHEINPVFIPTQGILTVDTSNSGRTFFIYNFTTPILVKNSIQIKGKVITAGSLNPSKIVGNITLISGDYDE